MRRKKLEEFASNFEFASSVTAYNHDTWDDLMKYVKRKARTKTDDKIAEIIANREQALDGDDDVKNGHHVDVDGDGDDDELALSDDELKHDGLRLKEKHLSKKQLAAKLEAKKRNGATTVVDEGANNGGDDDELADEDRDFFEDATESDQINSFYQMNLSRPLMRAIGVLGYIYPTPIQATTIPIALLGRDIAGCAATGTGKTAAYMLPTLERLLYRPLNNKTVTRVLVLVPTRELGAQVYQVTKQLSQFTSIETGLAIGGLDLKAQENILRQNPDVVIATPGRLIDHIKNTPSFTLDSIEVS